MPETQTSESFLNPPLIEVVCGVQFEAPSFSSIHFGLYANHVCRRFKYIAPERSPLSTSDSFGISELPPLRRVWYESIEDSGLIQLQSNRFLYNWRRKDQEEYPRFTRIFPAFEKEWEVFREWYSGEAGELLIPTKYQLTYLNEVDSEKGWKLPKDTSTILSFLNPSWGESILHEILSQQHKFQFRLPKDLGILTVGIQQISNKKEDPQCLLIEFSASSGVNVDTFEIPSMDYWFSDANKAIVKSFLSLTTDEIQNNYWGRQ